MAAQIKLFHRLFWLLDTIYSAKQISLPQIDKRWEQSHYNEKHEHEYGKRNLLFALISVLSPFLVKSGAKI